MAKHGVKTLIYSSTCATYGEPERMPITEETPQVGNLAVACIFYNCLVLMVYFCILLWSWHVGIYC